ncbi:MAG: 50S ribosomal protein L22 [Planctomycetes bacterium]|nr:50S ribosomal protein L22 [Planctomycetota bacterium]
MAEQTTKEFHAIARNVRMSARKARLVMDIVRGRNAVEAMTLLRFVNKRAAPEISKLIRSAVANAEEYANRSGVPVETETLVVADAFADEGPRMKRWRPRSRGMAHPFTRHTCHMTVRVAEAAHIEEKKKGRPAFARPRKRISKEQRLAKREGAAAAVKEAAKPAAKAARKADKPAAKEEAKAAKKPAKKAGK